jgi:hypothetical protein
MMRTSLEAQNPWSRIGSRPLMSVAGQTEKNSVRANVFRITPESRHRSIQLACLKGATSGYRRALQQSLQAKPACLLADEGGGSGVLRNKAVCSGERDERGGAQEHRDRIPKGGMDDDERYQTNGEGRRHMDFKHP